MRGAGAVAGGAEQHGEREGGILAAVSGLAGGNAAEGADAEEAACDPAGVGERAGGGAAAEADGGGGERDTARYDEHHGAVLPGQRTLLPAARSVPEAGREEDRQRRLAA